MQTRVQPNPLKSFAQMILAALEESPPSILIELCQPTGLNSLRWPIWQWIVSSFTPRFTFSFHFPIATWQCHCWLLDWVKLFPICEIVALAARTLWSRGSWLPCLGSFFEVYCIKVAEAQRFGFNEALWLMATGRTTRMALLSEAGFENVFRTQNWACRRKLFCRWFCFLVGASGVHIATPRYSATPWYVLIQSPNVIDTMKRWRSKRAFNILPSHIFP